MSFLLTRRTALAAAASSAAGAFAQSPQPGATNTFVVPMSAGSVADLLARKMGMQLADATGEAWVIENVPGASGALAARQVLRKSADGRTLLWGYSGLICATPLLAKPALEFDPVTDFTPVCTMSASPMVLFAGKDFPANDLEELRAFARTQAEPLSYIANDIGSANHVAAESLLQTLGIRGLHVPYRNTMQAYIDVAEGRVQLGIQAFGLMGSQLQGANRAKVLAVLANKPLAAEPRYRTVPAQGFGPFDIQGWFGVFAPRGTPEARMADLERLMSAVLHDKAYSEAIVQSGQEVAFRGRAQTRRFVDEEARRYRSLLQKLKLI
ncbi:tripartite tricarboxylate transporter substrate binding protein [Caenimonas koreensis]|nr:tripartite tricarboxylate transporter substrate binding protein [Caenimonas koreensis]